VRGNPFSFTIKLMKAGHFGDNDNYVARTRTTSPVWRGLQKTDPQICVRVAFEGETHVITLRLRFYALRALR
jgi:hypothetical protein